MSHFSDEVWADWARGIPTGAGKPDVQSHLSSGCDECRASLELWKAVAELGRRDATYEPPPDVLERAIALFGMGERPEIPKAKAVLLAELVFDSFRSPLPAGIRTLERATRHLGYKAGDFFVDLRIEDQGASGGATVIGQLAKHPADASAASVEGCAVILTRGPATVGEATTNRFGEFSLEMSGDEEHQIAIRVGDGISVMLPLGGRRASS